MGFDKILLIEGVTETKTVQQFLRKFGKDHKVLLLPMGGGSLINGQDQTETQLEELKRVTSNIYALIDSERVAAGTPLEQARQDFQHLCARVGITCHVLDWRATENYLSQRAITQVMGPNYSALTPYQARNTVQPIWKKSMNWAIAREMTLVEIESTDLGLFLKDL